jgi:xylose isomerase
MKQDLDVLEFSQKFVNIMDMSSPKELYLLDVFSDATRFGGQSETQLLHNQDKGFLRVTAKFVKETQALQLENDVMFCGFENVYLLKKEFDIFNGIRVTMKPPAYPCKFGLHIKVGMGNEYELFLGHIMDTNNAEPDKWQTYELPLTLMHNDMVMSKVLNPRIGDNFSTGGLVFKTESNKETTDENEAPLVFDIKSVDLIFNNGFDQL